MFDRYRIRKANNGYVLTVIEDTEDGLIEDEVIFEFKSHQEVWNDKTDSYEVLSLTDGLSEKYAFSDLMQELVENEGLNQNYKDREHNLDITISKREEEG